MTISQAGDPLVPPPKGKWVRFDKNERIPDWVFPQANETDCRFGTTVQVGWWEKLDGYAFVPIDCDPDGVISIPQEIGCGTIPIQNIVNFGPKAKNG